MIIQLLLLLTVSIIPHAIRSVYTWRSLAPAFGSLERDLGKYKENNMSVDQV